MERPRVRQQKTPPPYLLASVDHALVLAVLLQVEGPQTVSSAATRLGVARSTAHRLLAMLVYRDFAVQRADRTYAAGPVLSLAVTSRSRTARLREVALGHLEALADRVGESVNLVVRSGVHTRFVATIESDQVLRVGNREGMVFPAEATSGGQVLLADLEPEEVTTLYLDGRPFSDVAETLDLPALRRRLAKVRERGFAINVEGTESGVTAIGMAIRAGGGPAEAAVAISLPSVRFSRQRLPGLLAALTQCVRAIESEMSGSQPEST